MSDLALVLEVEVPRSLFALVVLQIESDDSLSVVESILAVALVSLERLVNDVEGGG